METTTLGFIDLIRGQLDAVEEAMRAQSGLHHPSLDEAVEQLLASGGKRIRPAVVLLVGELLGTRGKELVTLAAAIEMLHTATLVHDDLIDGSVLRRGAPTLNSRWSPGATVLTGDYIFARAAYLASRTGSLQVMEAFAQTLMTIVNGEISQLAHGTSLPDRDEYLGRIYAKTASLFELAAEGGAMLSTQDVDQVQTLKAVGYSLGVAFQMVDDVLDFVGDPRDVGKPVGSDLRHGLVTSPAIYFALEHPAARAELTEALAGRLEGTRLEAMIAAIAASDAVQRSMDEARAFVAEARDALRAFPSSPARSALLDLAAYVVERSV
jgi:geranylgeranyl pyrophosphate synthase